MDSDHIKVNAGKPDELFVEVLVGETLPIGRKPPSDGSKCIVLPYPEVSGRHAEIRSTSGGWILMDRNSTNGTTINGKVCAPGTDYLLKHGDSVRIAQYELIIHAPRLGVAVEHDDPEDQYKMNLFLDAMPVQELPDFEEDKS